MELTTGRARRSVSGTTINPRTLRSLGELSQLSITTVTDKEAPSHQQAMYLDRQAKLLAKSQGNLTAHQGLQRLVANTFRVIGLIQVLPCRITLLAKLLFRPFGAVASIPTLNTSTRAITDALTAIAQRMATQRNSFACHSRMGLTATSEFASVAASHAVVTMKPRAESKH